MQFKKKILESDFARCYSAAAFTSQGETKLLYATEGQGPCLAFSGPDCAVRETVWAEPGGTMGMVPVPGKNGDFLAVQRFFRLCQWEEACLVWAEARAGGWTVHPLFTLPYLHRFDILRGADGTAWLIVCTLATARETREDWREPGCVYTAPMPASWKDPVALVPLKNDLYQNHGYCRVTAGGREHGLITGREGVFLAAPPASAGGEWGMEKVLDRAVSDAAFADIDGDGENEMACLEPFHGNSFRVYKKRHGVFECVYELDDHSDFYHVVWGGELAGKNVFIGGGRRGSQALFALSMRRGEFVYHLAERGVGPSNVAVLRADASNAHITHGKDCILAANREIGEAALYFVE